MYSFNELLVKYPKLIYNKSQEEYIINIFSKTNIHIQKRHLQNKKALNNFALYYELVKLDYKNAIKYYLLSVNKKNPLAMFYLGLYYEENKDYVQAIKYYEMGAELDHLESLEKLIKHYENVEKNKEKVIEYNHKILIAKNKDDKISLYNIAVNFEHIEKNIDHALIYYKIAAEQGDINSICRLANYYTNEKKYDNAVTYYKKAIELGDIKSISLLAEHYEINEKKYDEAIKKYQIGIEKDCSVCMQKLVNHFINIKNDLILESLNNIANEYYINEKYDLAIK